MSIALPRGGSLDIKTWTDAATNSAVLHLYRALRPVEDGSKEHLGICEDVVDYFR